MVTKLMDLFHLLKLWVKIHAECSFMYVIFIYKTGCTALSVNIHKKPHEGILRIHTLKKLAFLHICDNKRRWSDAPYNLLSLRIHMEKS